MRHWVADHGLTRPRPGTGLGRQSRPGLRAELACEGEARPSGEAMPPPLLQEGGARCWMLGVGVGVGARGVLAVLAACAFARCVSHCVDAEMQRCRVWLFSR